MQDIPFGQLLLLLAFIFVPLINWLLQRMQRRFETRSPREEPPRQPAPRTFAKPPPLVITESARGRVSAPKMAETPPRSRTQRRNKDFFKSRGELRRAIVLMTVLDPCRAVEDQRSEVRGQIPELGATRF